MKIAFAGTPHFASHALQTLLEHDFEISFVLTQPDKPAGRGMKLQQSPVKQLAIQHNINVYQPTSLKKDGKDAELATNIHNLLNEVDVLVVAAYGMLLPKSMVDNFLCLNIHASILPRWRGAAPIHRAIQAGDEYTGISIMHMNEGLDTGDILYINKIPIEQNDTTASLHDKLAVLGGASIVHTINNFSELQKNKISQDTFNQELVTYAHKISKQEAQIDLNDNIEQIYNNIKAFNPFPIAQIGEYKIWQANVTQQKSNANNGEIISLNNGKSISIACSNGNGCIEILELQTAGKKRMHAHEFLLGHTLKVGDNLHPISIRVE
ncbi:MAG: hypothetical protein RLZZ210_279 [Pseudomonadota bacterium]|jgi:methionyl-tRNA formyltransferase